MIRSADAACPLPLASVEGLCDPLRVPEPPPDLTILSENPLQTIWLHLSAFESVPLCERMIRERAATLKKTLGDDLVKAKAVALAYFMRNAREYFSDPPAESTKRILVSYYGLLSIACALLVADPSNDHDLASVERATAHGHGMGSTDGAGGLGFPDAPRLYIKAEGFFVEYLRNENVDPTPLVVKGSTSKPKPAAQAWDRGVSLDDMIARLPELAELYYQVTTKSPLSVAVSVKTYSLGSPVSVRFKGVTELAEDFIQDTLRPPMTFQRVVASDSLAAHWRGHVPHTKERPWHEELPTYFSSMAYWSWFKPVLGVIHDPIALHLMASYLLSIIVRYKPSVWREVVRDGGSTFYPLIRAYIEVVHRVVPEFVLQQLLYRRVTSSTRPQLHPDLSPYSPVMSYR